MDSNARVYIIACGVLAKDIEAIAKKLPLTIGTHYLPAGLHERPNKLRRKLQAAIDRAANTGEWDRIVVGYGVCGRGTVDVRAQDIPLVIPRVHDCIALFLGGDNRYQEQFKQYPGTYYISHGWYEAKSLSKAADRRHAWMGDTKVYFDELVQRYGLRHAEATFSFSIAGAPIINARHSSTPVATRIRQPRRMPNSLPSRTAGATKKYRAAPACCKGC